MSAGRKWAVAICAALAAAVGIAFGPALGCGFINLDDDAYVTRNGMVRDGLTWRGIGWAFTRSHSSNWHPLTWISHMADCQLYGLNPAGHHFGNVALHAATAIALFLVLHAMTGTLWQSAAVAAVFALHPFRVESVAWIAERKDVLSGLCFMLTLGAYLGYARRPGSVPRYLLVVLCLALGLMAKPTLVTVPFLLLLLDYWPLGRFPAAGERFPCRLLWEKLPLLALAVGSCVLTLHAQTRMIVTMEDHSLPARLANAAVSYVAYLGQAIWPSGLALIYPFPPEGTPVWEAIGAALLLSAISAAVFVLRKQRPYLLVGWGWYLGMLVPMIGLVQVGVQTRADRYTYLSQIGVAMMAAWGVADLAARWPQTRRRWALGIGMGALLMAWTICCRVQISHWRDAESVWSHTLTATGPNDVAEEYLGRALLSQGRYGEAAVHLQSPLAHHPQEANTRYLLCNALLHAGRTGEVAATAREGLALDPEDSLLNLALGNALLQQGAAEGAEACFRKVIADYPGDAAVRNNLGAALARQGRMAEAIIEMEQAVALDPNHAGAHSNLGHALRQQGRGQEGTAHLEQALALAVAQGNTPLADSLREELHPSAPPARTH